jgi:DDE superfamily endonuclease
MYQSVRLQFEKLMAAVASTTAPLWYTDSAPTTEATMALSQKEMLGIAIETLRMPRRNEKETDRIIRGFFGAPISVVTKLWNLVEPLIAAEYRRSAFPKHLTWALILIKVYSTEDVHCSIVGWPDPKTFRKWAWYFLELIASLRDDVIQLDRRLDGVDAGTVSCLMSVDGTDCLVMDPWPFDKKWYSQKLNGPGVKYEVGVSIANCDIVWINGPFVASKNDSTIFREKLSGLLAIDEGVEVDKGYTGDDKLMHPNVNIGRLQRCQKNIVRGRHETVNSRLKIFNVLNVPFRHTNPRDKMMGKHHLCFTAIAVITQLKFDEGEKLYDVHYDTIYY